MSRQISQHLASTAIGEIWQKSSALKRKCLNQPKIVPQENITPNATDENDHDSVEVNVTRDGSAEFSFAYSQKDKPEAEENVDHREHWPLWKKLQVVFTISFYTFAVYASSAAYIPDIPQVMVEYGLSEQKALLGLSLFVLGYGVGPLLWAPLSEVHFLGRNPIYFGTAVLYLICSILTAVVRNYGAFAFFRFMSGFFGSPCLANGGASLHDLLSEEMLPIALSIWVVFAYAGPALGPILSSYVVQDQGWRITMWELVALAGFTVILLSVLPETYGPKVVYHHKRRSHLMADNQMPQSESMFHRDNGVWKTIKTSLIKPIQISLQDPAITYVNIYTSYLYGTYYTFFSSFTLLYPTHYQFSPAQIGLTFIPIIIGGAVATAAYCFYVTYSLNPKLARSEMTSPEAKLWPALIGIWLPPIGIFTFGWTIQYHVHWIAGMVGVAIYSGGVFVILQCLSIYILQSYPRYAASLFAANDFCRSMLAAAAVHFGLPLYTNLGPGDASSVLGGVSVLGIVGMVVLFFKGEALRAKSRFTGER